MHKMGPKIEVSEETGLIEGTNTVEFHTLGFTSENLVHGKYFSNFKFIAPRYPEDREIHDRYALSDGNLDDQWTNANVIDPDQHELVIDCIDYTEERMSRSYIRSDEKENTKLFKVKVTYTVEEVDTYADEYAELRRWKALQKLSVSQIRLLGLEDQMVYLKLKYSQDTKAAKVNDRFF